MRERILTVVLVVGLGSLASGAEIRRPTTWTVSGSVTNVAGATDSDDASTYATVDGSNGVATVDYKGFPAASASYARLQLHVISSCDETNGDSCSVQVSFDNGSSWMPLYAGIAMGNGPNAPIDSSIDLEPTFNPSTVVVRVTADYSYDPGGCQDPDCLDWIPPSWYWGVAQVYGVYTAGTFGTPVAYTIRGSASGFDPNGDSSLCRYPGTLKHSTWYLPYSYDSDPNSSSYVYGTGGGNSSYAGTGSWVGGFNKPEPLGYMRLVMTVSCTASRQYWSLCDYAFTLDHGNSWYWAVETGDGGGGTFSLILPPDVDLSNFFVGVCAKAQYSGWSYAYLSDARIESYSQTGVPPPPFGWLDSAVDAADGDTTVTQYGTVNVTGWAADENTGAPVSRVEVRVDGSTVGTATLGGTRQDVVNAYGRSDYLYSGWNYNLSVGAMPTGTHTLTAVAFAPDGISATLSATKTITVTLPVPAISTISPNSGPVGTPVTITGNNFGGTQGSVTFNGTAGSPTSWNNAQIVVPVPSGATSGSIVVTTGGGQATSPAFTITVPAPSISSISPASGPVGTSVTITGTNFGTSQGASTVTFNGTAVAPSSWNSNTIVVPVPTGLPVGNVTIVVNVGGQTTNSVNFAVTPHITALSLTTGPAKMGFVITGTSFGASQGTNSGVNIGTAQMTVISWSDTTITVQVPDAASTGNVVATINGVPSNGVMFTVVAPVSCQ